MAGEPFVFELWGEIFAEFCEDPLEILESDSRVISGPCCVDGGDFGERGDVLRDISAKLSDAEHAFGGESCREFFDGEFEELCDTMDTEVLEDVEVIGAESCGGDGE